MARKATLKAGPAALSVLRRPTNCRTRTEPSDRPGLPPPSPGPGAQATFLCQRHSDTDAIVREERQSSKPRFGGPAVFRTYVCVCVGLNGKSPLVCWIRGSAVGPGPQAKVRLLSSDDLLVLGMFGLEGNS